MSRRLSVPTLAVTLVMAAGLATAGCESRGGSALLGGGVGAAAGAGTYEYRLDQERKRVEQAYKAGEMDRREYEIRMDQISRDSFIQ